MNEEQRLYKQQMALWFEEQRRLDEELARAIAHYQEMAALNQAQLELHRRRITLGRNEFDTWLSSLDAQGGDGCG